MEEVPGMGVACLIGIILGVIDAVTGALGSTEPVILGYFLISLVGHAIAGACMVGFIYMVIFFVGGATILVLAAFWKPLLIIIAIGLAVYYSWDTVIFN